MDELENYSSVLWLTITHDLIQSVIDLELLKCLDPEIVANESLENLRYNLDELKKIRITCNELERKKSSKCTFGILIVCNGHIDNIEAVIDSLQKYRRLRTKDRTGARIEYFRETHDMDSCLDCHIHCNILDLDIFSLNQAFQVTDSLNFYWFLFTKAEKRKCIKDITLYCTKAYGTHFIVPPFLYDIGSKCSKCMENETMNLAETQKNGITVCNHIVFYDINLSDAYDSIPSIHKDSAFSLVNDTGKQSDKIYWSMVEKGSHAQNESGASARNQDFLDKAMSALHEIDERKKIILTDWKDLSECFCMEAESENYVGHFGLSPKNNIDNRNDYLSEQIYSTYSEELKELRQLKKNEIEDRNNQVIDVEELIKISERADNGDAEMIRLLDEMKDITSAGCFSEANNSMIEVKEKQILKKIDNVSNVLKRTYSDMVKTMFPPVIGSTLIDRLYLFQTAANNMDALDDVLSSNTMMDLDGQNKEDEPAMRLCDALSQINLEDYTRAKISETIKRFVLGPLRNKFENVPLRDGIHLHSNWSALNISAETKLKMKMFCSLEEMEALTKAKTFKEVFDRVSFEQLTDGTIQHRFEQHIKNIRFFVCVIYCFNEYSIKKISMYKREDYDITICHENSGPQLKPGIYLPTCEGKIVLAVEDSKLKTSYYTSTDIYKLLYVYAKSSV